MVKNVDPQAIVPAASGQMGPQPAVRGMVDTLIEHARNQLALQGARALSFRRLAAAAGVTLAVLSYHLGSKSQILQTLIESERARDRVRHHAWLERFERLAGFDPPALAALIELYLDESAADEASGGRRLTSMIWSDLMLRAGVDGATAALLRPWLSERRDFWSRMLAGRIGQADTWAEVVMSYVSDEGIHSLALGGLGDYRLLRRMTIERLVHRLEPASRSALADSAVFADLVRRLDPALGLAGAGDSSDLIQPGRRRDIAAAACEVILDEGVEALTHRAVAERLSIPASSVAYHFRSGADLLLAGQQVVYLVAQGQLPAPGEDSMQRRQQVTVRGTLSIGLAAARDPSLVAQAIDLRRLRGENLTKFLQLQGRAGIDGLDGQVAALVGLGATALVAADASLGIDPGALMNWLIEHR